jgi:hypothetical protein
MGYYFTCYLEWCRQAVHEGGSSDGTLIIIFINNFIAFFMIITLFFRLYTWVGILHTRGKHVHGRSFHYKGRFESHKNSATLPLLNEMPVPSQESVRSCICLLGHRCCPFLRFLFWIVVEMFRRGGICLLRYQFCLFYDFYFGLWWKCSDGVVFGC